MPDLYKYRVLAVIISNHFPFLPISGPDTLRCWMLRHLVESLDKHSHLDPSRIRLNGNCQVILLSILLSHCEAIHCSTEPISSQQQHTRFLLPWLPTYLWALPIPPAHFSLLIWEPGELGTHLHNQTSRVLFFLTVQWEEKGCIAPLDTSITAE